MHDLALVVRDVSKTFPAQPGLARQVLLRDFSLVLRHGQRLGLVGPSGAGKSTLVRMILGLERPESGSIHLHGLNVLKLSAQERRKKLPGLVQVVWQDPLVYLNPYYSLFELISEPLMIHRPGLSREDIEEQVLDIIRLVDLPPKLLTRRPHEISGGQCQRAALARALMLRPKLLICDEILVSLDLPQQVRILDMINDICSAHHMSLLFISHDIDAIRLVCDETLDIEGMTPKKGPRS